MSNVVNRTTKAYLTSVNEPDYPLVDWIHDPDMTPVEVSPGVLWDSKYWIITGDILSLMDQTARDAVDQAEADALLAENKQGAVDEPDNVETYEGWELRAIIELFNKRDNYLTNRVIQLQDHIALLQTTIANGTGGVGNTRTDVGNLNLNTMATATRDRPAAITDYRAIINNDEVNT